MWTWCMVLILVISGCQVRPTVTPVPQLTPAPTSTPQPTATPMPPQPPIVVSTSPARGQELAPLGSVILQFDQPMDRASTEKAFSIQPEVRGSLAWDDPRTLRFTPTETLTSGQYRITITSTAQSAQSLNLLRPVELSFRPMAGLVVSDALPAPDSTDVPTDSAIRIAFNRPIVPLASVQAQTALANPLQITPALRGEGRWVNTSIFVFEPSEPMAPGTRYAVSVAAGLSSTSGVALTEEYRWSFMTQLPGVTAIQPPNNARHISPYTGIRVAFNQPMQRESVQKEFALVKQGTQASIPGRYAWISNTLYFTPTQPLEDGALYTISIQKGALAATGSASLPQMVQSQFRVAEIPAVTSFVPREGDADVDLWRGIEIAFSSPISRATFTKGFTITPAAQTSFYWSDEDTRVNVSTYLQPSTRYTVTLTTEILGRYGQRLRQGTTVHFSTRPQAPQVSMAISGRMAALNAYDEPRIYGSYLNVSRISLALFKLPQEDLIALHGDNGWQLWDRYSGQERNLVRRWTIPANAPLNETRVFSTTLQQPTGGNLTPGFYYLEVSAPELKSATRQLIVLSDTTLTLKSAVDEVLLWATDMRDAAPVRDVSVMIYEQGGKRIAEAKTGADGVARAAIPKQDPWASLIVIAQRGDSLSAVLKDWSDGINPWDYDLMGAPGQEPYRGFVYTDRRIYRPGQLVYFKGILRADDDGRYSLPGPSQVVTVTVTDGQGREIWNQMLSLNDMGTFDGKVLLSDSAALGYYYLQVQNDQDYYLATNWQVAEYRVPEFQVSVTPEDSDYIQGDTIHAVAEASYFFGGPLANAPVTWAVTRSPYGFDRFKGTGRYDFTDWDEADGSKPRGFGGLVTEGDGQTDAQGRFSFSLPANIAEYNQSQVYTIEASVTDLNNQQVSARATVIVHKGEYYIGLAAPSRVGTVGKEATVQAITVDTQGLTVTNKSLQVVVYRREWFSVREQMDGGGFYWTSTPRDTAVVTKTVTTDSNGQALVSFTPAEGGTYRVVATGLDARENEVRSATYMWVSGAQYVSWRQEDNNRIELIADKESYRPGETAHILIPSPYQGATKALLTIERGGVLEYRLLELASNSEQLALPILAEYAPNVYVSIVIVKGVDAANPTPSFRLGYVMLPVSTEQQELKITISPSRSTAYQPRDKATFDIEVVDYRGQPVDAELSLQLVDLAVESLTGPDTRSIKDAFYSERGLGVRTASTLAIMADRVTLERAAGAKGGSGASADEGMVRRDFADTAFWEPAVRTGADGKASVTVDLPDNLTTWRMTGQGVTTRTEVGRTTADIVTSLDVMIRPVAPRFMVIGDQPTLGAVVHNNTASALTFDVTLQAQGLAVQNGAQQITVPAKGRATVQWPATAGAAEQAVLRFTARAASYADSIELTLPIYHPSSPEVVGTSGQVFDRVLELVQLPAEADLSLGELSVVLEPSLAAGMRDGLKYVETYPYECIEQTVSRFLPNVITYRALNSLGIQNAELSAKLPQQVGVGLQRLYTLQGLDGGWGWWGNQESAPLITAYVVLGLAEAQGAEFSVDQRVMNRAISYLYKRLDQKTVDSAAEKDLRAMILFALAKAGQGDLGRTVALFEKRADMSIYAKAYLGLTLDLLEPQEPVRRQMIANELATASILSATGAHWEEAQRSAWAMNTDVRTTAIALAALLQLNPQSSVLPNAVRWLMTIREHGRWQTTQENVWSIWALTDYMVATGELLADYDYTLWINGAVQIEGTANAATLDEAAHVQIAAEDLRHTASNEVVIERSAKAGQKGTGNLYYSMFLRYYLPADKLAALDRGIIVQREYYLGKDLLTPQIIPSVNDVITVKLTLIAPNDLHFLVLEDPFPAGCEAIDTSLQTSSILAQAPMLDPQAETDRRAWQGYYWYWFTHSELRDEKVALFADYIPRGTYEYTYSVRCTTPGQFKVMPATAYEMYFADVFGRSAGDSMTIAGAD
jgi:uncharacterized protein YfaS (alpha-2-macroglobulin family)